MDEVGSAARAARVERARLDLPSDVELESIPVDKTLSQMLADGALDALIAARVPSCFKNGAPHVGRLYPDYRAAEQDYFRRTGLFHIMWVIGVRKSLVERYPWLPTNVYRAFVEAKRIAIAELEAINALSVTLPWLAAEVDATREVMGEDYWPYGIEGNAICVETMARYAFEQGLADRQMTVQELFAEQTFEIAKV